MVKQLTFKRIIISGLCIYIFLTVYFLLSVISTDKTQLEYSYEDVHTADVKSEFKVDFVQKTDNAVISIKRGKYEIKLGEDIDRRTREDEKKTTKKLRTPKPTKPPRVKTTSVHKRFRQLSTVNQNFSEIARKVFVYSAFLDDRYNTTYIRLTVIAPSGRKKKPSGIFCMFNNRQVTELVFYETCESHLKRNSYYVMSCEVPPSQVHRFDGITPLTISPSMDAKPEHYKFISVVNNRGLSQNNDNKLMGKFAVCVPPLFGKVNVLRLVEFIELTRLLGSSHFIFYTYGVADDIIRVLQHYRQLGLVTIMPWFIPVGEEIWYKGQSVAVGDCLLRNMHINELVAFNDIDEFIMSNTSHNWTSLVELLRKKTSSKGQDVDNIAVYRFQSSFFDTLKRPVKGDLTGTQQMEKLVMDKFVSLSRTKRTKTFSNLRTKMLAYPLRVFELGIHHLSKQLKEEYFCLNVEPEVAFLHHYRKCDYNYGTICSPFVEDTSALYYKNPLINNTIRVLKNLKYSRTNWKESKVI